MSDERAVSKVVLNGKTLIDITNSTVTNENLLDGEIATGANGRGVVGGIPINTSANLTTSGATVRVPAGYYAEQVSKTIASGSATTPSTEITANPSIAVSNSGLITTSAAANQSITPTVVAGYVTEGTAGIVTVSGSNTKQLDTSSVVGGTTTISGTTATRAKATWNRGWIQAGELAAATFANSATSGKTYVDISNTTAAPILVSGNYLYINAGYTDNLKISLAKLVPDGASVDLAEDKMLSGYSAYNNNGQLITGNIPTKASSDLTANGATVNVPAGYYATNVSKTISSGSATISGSITTTPTISVSNSGLITASVNGSIGLTPTVDAGYITEGTTGTVNYSGSKTQQLTTKAATTFNTSASDQSIAAGTYLTGKQTIKAVTTSNINAENIKDGVTVKVGDANSAGRIKNVTGTFTDSSTVSSGQTAAAAGQMLNGYSAWVNGEEVKGSIATKTASNLTASGKTVTVPAGYYATQVTKDVASGSATTPATTITANPTITVNTTTGVVTATANASKSITPTVSAGYVSAGTAGTVTVNGSGTSQIDVYNKQSNEQQVLFVTAPAGAKVYKDGLLQHTATGDPIPIYMGTPPSSDVEYSITLAATKDNQESQQTIKMNDKIVYATLTFDTTAFTAEQGNITYTNGISDLSASNLNEIAKAISNNSLITNKTKEVWISNYNRHISVGDTIAINIDGAPFNCRIIGFNHDDLTTPTIYGSATATGKAGITLDMMECYEQGPMMNIDQPNITTEGYYIGTNRDGWRASRPRSRSNYIKNKFDSAWINIIKTVNKKTTASLRSSEIDITSDDLFLLSVYEIKGDGVEGNQYAYFTNYQFLVGADWEAINKKFQAKFDDWWLRTPNPYNTTSWYLVLGSDGDTTGPVIMNFGISYTFCI